MRPSVPMVQMNLVIVNLDLPSLHLPNQSLTAHTALPLYLLFLQSFASLLISDAGC